MKLQNSIEYRPSVGSDGGSSWITLDSSSKSDDQPS